MIDFGGRCSGEKNEQRARGFAPRYGVPRKLRIAHWGKRENGKPQ
jgi:hypothetical protein